MEKKEKRKIFLKFNFSKSVFFFSLIIFCRKVDNWICNLANWLLAKTSCLADMNFFLKITFFRKGCVLFHRPYFLNEFCIKYISMLIYLHKFFSLVRLYMLYCSNSMTVISRVGSDTMIVNISYLPLIITPFRWVFRSFIGIFIKKCVRGNILILFEA